MKNPNIANKRQERPIRILDAAARLITRYGYDKTTMDDIAREAGVSKGALYLVWSGREDLFDALFEHEMKKLILDLRVRIENDPQLVSLASLYGHTLLAMQTSPLITALYTRDGRILGDFLLRQDPDRYAKRLLMSRESVAAMQAAGLLRSDISPETLSYLFMIIALGVLSISSIIPVENAPPLGETVEAVSAMIQGGLALPAGNTTVVRDSTLKMLELMLTQYEDGGRNEI